MQPLQTMIAIGGKLQSSLGQSIKAANLQLQSLNATAMRVNASMASIGRRLATGVLSAAGIYGVVQVMRESVNLARQEEDVRIALTNLIANQNRLRGISVEQSQAQVALLEKQSTILEAQSGIYHTTILHGATTLAQYKLTTAEILQMQPAMVEIMSYQRLMGKSSEEIAGTYEAIGKAIHGMGRGLKQAGVELSDYQLRVLKINAMMGDYAANARMIQREIIRQHGGATRAFTGTLPGQAQLAQTMTQSAIERIGEGLLPLVQIGQIIVSRFIQPLAAHFDQLHRTVLDHWKEWVAYIDRVVVPTFTRWVDRGWQKITDAVTWFERNSSWLLPWLKKVVVAIGVWTFVIGPLIKGIGALRMALIALDLSNPFTAIAAAAAVAAAYIISNWSRVKSFLGGIWESIVGTKVFNASEEPAGVMRAYRPGQVPRAQEIQHGWIANIKGLWSGFFNWLGPETQKNLADINDRFQKIFGDLMYFWNQYVAPVLPVVWDTILKTMNVIKDVALAGIKIAIQTIIEQCDRWLTIIQTVLDAFKAIDQFIHHPPGIDTSFKRVPPGSVTRGGWRPGGAFVGHIPWAPGHAPTYNIPASIRAPGDLNITHYGYRGDTTPDWNSSHWIGGWNNTMTHPYTGTGTTSVALMSKLANQWGLKKGDTFTYVTPNGQRYSFIYEDVVPKGYTDKAGRWHPYRDLRMDIFDPYNRYHGGIQSGGHVEDIRHAGVTINYNVGGIHVHGADSDDAHKRLAAVHQKHIEDIRRSVEEALYRDNRQDLGGAYAV